VNRSIPFVFVLVFLTASCIIIQPANASAEATENSWASKAPMQQARAGLGVAVVYTKIYAIGGMLTPSWLNAVGTNEVYDPASDSWSYKASMPTPRANFGIAVVQNKIYVIGGWARVGEVGPVGDRGVVVYGTNEVYDPATGTWETKAPMPTPREGLRANVVDGKIYLIGGNSSANEVYDPQTDSWTTKTPIPTVPRVYYFGWSCASAVIEDKVHVIGLNYNGSYHEIYDPETNSWSKGADVPSGANYSASCATTGTNAPTRIYVFGVDSLLWELGVPNLVNNVYNPENDSWGNGASMPTPRINAGVAVVDDLIYAIGGEPMGLAQVTFASAANELYTPLGYGTIPSPSPIPTPSPSPTQQPETSPSPTIEPTPTPTPTTSSNPTPDSAQSSTPTTSPSNSPTQQPTIEPTQSAEPTIAPSNVLNGIGTLLLTLGIVAVVIVAVTIVGLAVYSKKYKKSAKNAVL
jgi:N-acetylneuraminic acid mutarotase